MSIRLYANSKNYVLGFSQAITGHPLSLICNILVLYTVYINFVSFQVIFGEVFAVAKSKVSMCISYLARF